MTLKTPLICAACLLLAGAAAVPFIAGTDYTSLPPAASDVSAMLDGKKIDLVSAIAVATKSVGGKVASASYDLKNNAKSIHLEVFTKSKKHKVMVDTNTGEIMSDEITPRFPGEAVEGDWIETDSGLKYFDIVVGDGEMPQGPATKVSVHYSGYLVDGTKFDSSVDRGRPSTFPLNGVIGGWTEGVGSMRVGGKRKLIIPYALAYGAGGRPPTIPAKATLIFDIELLEIVSN